MIFKKEKYAIIIFIVSIIFLNPLRIFGFSQGVQPQQSKDSVVVIKINILGDLNDSAKIYLLNQDKEFGFIDSAMITDKHFELRLPFKKPYLLSIYTKVNKAKFQPLFLIISEPGKLKLEGEIEKGMKSFLVAGLKSAVESHAFDQSIDENTSEVYRMLTAKYGNEIKKIRNKDSINKILNEKDSIYKILVAKTFEKLIKSNPDSYTAVVKLNGYGRTYLNILDLKRLYEMLSINARNSLTGKETDKFIDRKTSPVINTFAKNFILNSPEDKPIKLSDFKGKYIMIDFWASWCGPCKESFPWVKELYSRYKEKPFEIYSISLDKDKEAWLKALKESNLPWVQALDSNGVVADEFDIRNIPTTLLIDPDGKILLKEVGVDMFDNKVEIMLESLFGIKPVDSIHRKTNHLPGNFPTDFTLNDEHDKPVSLCEFNGKFLLLDFWASWCGPCKKAIPGMKELYLKYKSRGFEILSVSVDRDKLDWLRELKIQKLPWKQVLDRKKIGAIDFSITGLPTLFLIDPNGKILLRQNQFDFNLLDQKLDSLTVNSL